MASQENINRLVELKNTAWAAAKELKERAIAENRDLSAEEQEAWDRANTDIDDANARLKDIRELAARQEVVEAFADMAAPVKESFAGSKTENERLHSILRDGAPAETFYMSPEFIAEHTKARNPAEKYAITTGTAITASLFAEKVVVYARTLNPTYDLATKLVTRTGGSLVVPRLTADPAADIVAEAGTITEASPTISSITLGAFAYKGLTYWSAEADQDEMVNLDQLIANSVGRQLGLSSGSDFTIGTDTVEPNGFITAANNGGTAAGTPFFLSTDIVNLFYALAAPYRTAPGAAWQVSNTALAKIRKFTDTNGTFLWQPGLNGGQADRLMGAPIYENPNMAAVASASKSVAFGDFSAYHVREVNGIRVEQSRDFLFNTDQVALKVVWRLDGDLPDVTAIKFLVSANS